MNAAELTTALGGKWNSATGQGSACCPAHEDRHPSLSISDGTDGRLLAYCHKGCAWDAIREALERQGLWERTEPLELVVPRNGTTDTNGVTPTPIRREVATYDYRDAGGAPLFQTVRYVPKDFRQRRPDGHGGWLWGLGDVEPVLYHLPELLSTPKTEPVLIVEGEKDCDRLRALGYTATCNPMGAKKWRDAYTAALVGRPCLVLPDNDPVGQEHAGIVAAALLGQAASLKIVQLPDLPPKGDVSDWLDTGHDRAALDALLSETPYVPQPEARYPIQTLAALTANVADVPAQLVQGILWSERVHWAFAAPGAGKTLFLLAAGLHIAAGRPFCERPVRQGTVLLIEEDTPFSVLGEYVQMLANIYGFDLARLPFYVNATQGLRLTDPEGAPCVWEAIAACPTPPTFLLLDACESLVPSEKFNTRELDPLRKLLQQVVGQHITPTVIDHTRRPPNQTAKEKAKLGPVDLLETLYGARAKQAISDVMMHFSGSPATGMRVTYCKFRGELPDPLDMTFLPESGFAVKPQVRRAKTENERLVLKFFADHPGAADKGEIAQGTGLQGSTLDRTLTALANRGWLIREGATRSTRYRPDTIVPTFVLEP